ncbi:hypothetical protein V5O48_000973 [Marasmius crinis-equi]|uniref:Uncharacterized protein n=1 Tax=Marasmius crinis-equi TaxID=585013 RepID=A0ABR3FZS8_9AGAR
MVNLGEYIEVEVIAAPDHGRGQPAVGVNIEFEHGSSLEIEPSLSTPRPLRHGQVLNSPVRQFRPSYLTVTDLSAPAWCERQYDYCLRRGLKRCNEETDRSPSFVTESGKRSHGTAKINTAEFDNAAMRKEKSVHQKRIAEELEIPSEPMFIKWETEEELWGSRHVVFSFGASGHNYD